MTSPHNHRPYFPLGFVHGDPRKTHHFGYNFRQLPSSAPNFADDQTYSVPPSYHPSVEMAYHSLAIAGESLTPRIELAKQAGEVYIDTNAYGQLPLSLNSTGEPWDRPLDCIDLFDPGTIQYLHDYVAAHVRTQTQGPLNDNIQLWGLDNEWEGRVNYSKRAIQSFIAWLKDAYANDVTRLNDAWGTVHPEFEAIHSQLPIKDSHAFTEPAKFLDWWTFQSEHFTRTLASLANTANTTDPQHRGVVHKSTQLTLEMPNWRERLLDHALFAKLLYPICGSYYGIDMYGHGDRQCYEINYVYNCIRRSNTDQEYGVMLGENNNHSGPASQFSATQWRLLANGLKSSVFFTTGFAGGTGDWDHFAFHDAKTGKMKEKFFATPRFANHIRRAEHFWTSCAPATNSPRIALLLPRRDVLLSQTSERTEANPRYTYPENHRWLCYRWLREQGYWVETIPYDQLTPKALKGYQALFLVGANHLNKNECATISDFVRLTGGKLIADSHAGFYDTHHQQLNQLDELLGLAMSHTDQSSGETYYIDSHAVKVSQSTTIHCSSAKQLLDDQYSNLPAYQNTTGNGQTLYFPFALGSAQLIDSPASLASMQSDAATAESEEYAAHPNEFEISRWLRSKLSVIGVEPAYSTHISQELYRVEQPVVDVDGNCAIIISTRAQTQPVEVLSPGSIEVTLPAGEWKHAWWASAESDDYQSIRIEAASMGGRYRLFLPEIATAGTVHLFQQLHPTLLSIAPIQGTDRSIDSTTPRVEPGESFNVTVSIIAPTTSTEKGTLNLQLPKGWSSVPEKHETKPILAGEQANYLFAVKVVGDHRSAQPDTLSTIHFQWKSITDQTSAFTCVEVVPAPKLVSRLLSNNASYPSCSPYRMVTQATYRYADTMNTKDIEDPINATENNIQNALTNGFSSIGGQRHSHHRDVIGEGHVARYNTRTADIIFDLKKEYTVTRVIIVAGVAPTYPSAIKIQTSLDNQSYQLISEQRIATPQLEIESQLFSARTRYVRIQVQWPEAGGCLDEIEIWGN